MLTGDVLLVSLIDTKSEILKVNFVKRSIFHIKTTFTSMDTGTKLLRTSAVMRAATSSVGKLLKCKLSCIRSMFTL